MDDEVSLAAAKILAGGIVVHATEGVWGFACDPLNEAAVEGIFAIKGRPSNKGLIVIGANAESFAPQLASLTSEQRRDVEASWPGRNTWILPDAGFPSWITGGRDTVACRVPGHEQARALAAAVGRPIVSTSANLSGEPPVTAEHDARALFGASVDFVLSGQIAEASGASTIRDLEGNVIRA